MRPQIVIKNNRVELSCGNLSAWVPGTEIRFAHLGCKVLGTIEEIPPDLAAQWDAEFGGRKNWANKKEVRQRLARSLANTVSYAQVDGIVLWDTMRRGSDYWRPGKFLTESADYLRAFVPCCEVRYERDDSLCPPEDLLHKFREDVMPFGVYAEAYAEYLRTQGGLELAAAAVIMALAQSRLAVFCCVDPYVPGYGDLREAREGLPYVERRWPPDLREEGCHRIVLAEEVTRFFTDRGLAVHLFEVDPTFERFHLRNLTPIE